MSIVYQKIQEDISKQLTRVKSTDEEYDALMKQIRDIPNQFRDYDLNEVLRKHDKSEREWQEFKAAAYTWPKEDKIQFSSAQERIAFNKRAMKAYAQSDEHRNAVRQRQKKGNVRFRNFSPHN